MGEESKVRVTARQSHHSTLRFPAYTGMTVRNGWNDGGFCEIV